MVTRAPIAYSDLGQRDPSSFDTNDYFTARLAITRPQEHPTSNGSNRYVLNLAGIESDRLLPLDLKFAFTDTDDSFKGGMGVFAARQLRGKPVVAVFRRSSREIVALIPSNEVL